MDKFLKVVLLPFVRHGLNAACTWLVLKGLTDQVGSDQIQGLTETLTGVIVASLNLAWSMVTHYFTHQQLSVQSTGVTPPKA